MIITNPSISVELSTYREHVEYMDRVLLPAFDRRLGVPRDFLGEVDSNFAGAARAIYPEVFNEQPTQTKSLATIPAAGR